jgi:endoglucanase
VCSRPETVGSQLRIDRATPGLPPVLALLLLLLLLLAHAAHAAHASGAAPALQITVSGNHLVDAGGAAIQLRGVNVSGLEFVAVQGQNPSNPWGGATGDSTPNWEAMKRWKINSVRIPLNEASWLGYKCANAAGAMRESDPGHNYVDTVSKTVRGATAAGLYVILELHWSAPEKFCPFSQNPMADEDNSVNFWSQVAGQFKSYPNVMFELFNEPYFWWITADENAWTVFRDGGAMTKYVTGDSGSYVRAYDWKAAGMQQLLDTVRATGAHNIIIVGAPSWSQDLSKWVQYRPKDELGQLAAAWHAYPNSATVGDSKAAEPKFGEIAYDWTQSVLDAGYPVLITEFGDHNAAGTKDAPFVSRLLPWADKHGVSYLGWTWDKWQEVDNVLIRDASGTPSPGYGQYVHQHLLCVADGKSSCP